MEESKINSNNGAGAGGVSAADTTGKGDDPSLWITDVREGSPAADAGLLLGDAVLSFGNFVPKKDMDIQQVLE